MIIAVVEVLDCWTTEAVHVMWATETKPLIPMHPEIDFGDYGRGRYAWRLGEVYPLLEPLKAAGKPGLWRHNWEPIRERLSRQPVSLEGLR